MKNLFFMNILTTARSQKETISYIYRSGKFMDLKRKLNYLKNSIAIIFLFAGAYVMDYNSAIALIKNETSDRLLIVTQPVNLMTDSLLYHELFDTDYVETHQSGIVALPNINPRSQPDTVKAYLYVFNEDSVYKYQTSKKWKV